MQLNLVSTGKKTKAQNIEISDRVFGQKFNEPLVHQIVTAYMAGARQGTRGQKNRSAVSGGGKKPWKQKGTGQARAGTTRSPIWRKGGVTFAAKPQDHSQKVNRKMYQSAMRSILSELARQERLVAVESFAVTSHKTKEFSNKLREMNLDAVMIVLEELDENVFLAARNLHKVDVRDVTAVDPVSLINYPKVLITVPALRKLEEAFA